MTIDEMQALDRARARALRRRYLRSMVALVWLWAGWSLTAAFFGLPSRDVVWVVAINLGLTVVTAGLLVRTIAAVETARVDGPVLDVLDHTRDRVLTLIAVWRQAAWLVGVLTLTLVFFDNDPQRGAFAARMSLATFAVPLLVICITQARGFLAVEASGLSAQIAALSSCDRQDP